jgi:predicted acyl esterase
VLVSRAVYRLTRNQRGRLVFQLNGNGWRFRKGHRAKLELLGRDAPTYRAVRSHFSATVSDLTVALPVRERPSRRRGIGSPR